MFFFTVSRRHNLNSVCFKFSGTVDALEKEQSEVGHRGASEPDQTIEILMSDLDPAVMDIFTRATSKTAAEATRVRIYHQMSVLLSPKIPNYLFLQEHVSRVERVNMLTNTILEICMLASCRVDISFIYIFLIKL